MEQHFWQDRWATKQIGFHEGAPNALLRTHGGTLRPDSSGSRAQVLVPLCGKSMDVAFLADAGFEVTGVEFVRTAADSFFAERQVQPVEEPWRGFPSLRSGAIRIAVGDFFSLELPESDRFDAAYDRAALVAIRPDDRTRYVATLLAALKPRARLLLVTFHHADGEMTGPPFSVDSDEVRRLFASCQVEHLESVDVTAREPRFRERRATKVFETAWLVTGL